MTDILGSSGRPNFLPAISGEIRRSVGSYARASRELSFAPKVFLHEGLVATLESGAAEA
jgi:nucleoside-diphosphate-sugar epimerase